MSCNPVFYGSKKPTIPDQVEFTERIALVFTKPSMDEAPSFDLHDFIHVAEPVCHYSHYAQRELGPPHYQG